MVEVAVRRVDEGILQRVGSGLESWMVRCYRLFQIERNEARARDPPAAKPGCGDAGRCRGAGRGEEGGPWRKGRLRRRRQRWRGTEREGLWTHIVGAHAQRTVGAKVVRLADALVVEPAEPVARAGGRAVGRKRRKGSRRAK